MARGLGLWVLRSFVRLLGCSFIFCFFVFLPGHLSNDFLRHFNGNCFAADKTWQIPRGWRKIGRRGCPSEVLVLAALLLLLSQCLWILAACLIVCVIVLPQCVSLIPKGILGLHFKILAAAPTTFIRFPCSGDNLRPQNFQLTLLNVNLLAHFPRPGMSLFNLINWCENCSLPG